MGFPEKRLDSLQEQLDLVVASPKYCVSGFQCFFIIKKAQPTQTKMGCQVI